MSFTYNPPDPIAQIRFMIGDTVNDPPDNPAVVSDEEIMMVLQFNGSQNIIVGLSGYAVQVPQVYSYGRSAAMVLNGLGSVRAAQLVTKVLDVQISLTTATKTLRELGQQLIDHETSAGYFSVAEMVQNPFSARERLEKMVLRQQT